MSVNEARGLTPGGTRSRAVHPLRVLDPACGSGSFLLGAYQFLLDWFLQKYADDAARFANGRVPTIYQVPQAQEGSRPEYRLTISERKRILSEHIFGVDIDPQAVEVTKLSLLLQVLEGESATSVGETLALFHERALPDLGSNIKCGNSLLGPDFIDEGFIGRVPASERSQIKAFDWATEFPSANAVGGFDVVIGNPPYVFGEFHDTFGKPYYTAKYGVAADQYDTYWLFVEAGLRRARPGGRFGLIVPDALLARDVAGPVRGLLLNEGLHTLYHCGLVFKDAAVSAVVFVVQKGTRPERIEVFVRDVSTAVERPPVTAQRFTADPAHRFLVHASDDEDRLLARLQRLGTLGDVAKVSRGEELGKKNVLEAGPVPILVGEDVSRYALRSPTRFIRRAEKRAELYRSPKIVLVKTGAKCVASIDYDSQVTMQSIYNIHTTDPRVSPEALLGIINSRLADWIVEKTFTAYKLLFPQLNQTTVESLPVNPGAGPLLANLERAVRAMLALQVELDQARTPQARTLVQRRVVTADRAIERAVHAACGLSEADSVLVALDTEVD